MDNIWIVVIGISFIFLMTTLGSALVFFCKKELSPKFNALFLGFASGVMIAASVWSLLLPAIDASQNYGSFSFLPAAVGLILGALFLFLLDKGIARFRKSPESVPSMQNSTKLFLAITIHNIPEGLSVGLAFGAALGAQTSGAFMSALWLAIGIGIQNFPEGAAVSLPMRGKMCGRGKAFLFGVGSGAVEPLCAIIGVLLASFLTVLQPWLLAFAAGAMIFITANDLIPESKFEKNSNFGAWGMMLGFVVMMILDVALG